MAPPDQSAKRMPATAGRVARFVILTAIVALVATTSWKALLAAVWNDDFPESLAVKVELMPVIFPLHMVAGGLALLLVPLAFVVRQRPGVHRTAGRIAAVDVAVAGLTAFPVAWIAPVTWWSSLGFAVQGALWLALLGAGIAFVRAGRVRAHRACMLMMLAVTSGAVFFRVWLALWAIVAPGRHFELFYACDAWFAWGAPLAVTAWLLHRDGAFEQAGVARTLAR